MKAKLISVTEPPEGKPIWFRTYEFECIGCGKHFTRHRFDRRTNPYCADCHRKYENERQRERNEAKKQLAVAEILDKISAEIKYMEYHMIDCDVLVNQGEVLDIIEKYRGVSK